MKSQDKNLIRLADAKTMFEMDRHAIEDLGIPGAVLMENMVVPDYSVAVGIPGRIIKKLTNQTYIENVRWAKKYVKLARLHKDQ